MTHLLQVCQRLCRQHLQLDPHHLELLLWCCQRLTQHPLGFLFLCQPSPFALQQLHAGFNNLWNGTTLASADVFVVL